MPTELLFEYCKNVRKLDSKLIEFSMCKWYPGELNFAQLLSKLQLYFCPIAPATYCERENNLQKRRNEKIFIVCFSYSPLN